MISETVYDHPQLAALRPRMRFLYHRAYGKLPPTAHGPELFFDVKSPTPRQLTAEEYIRFIPQGTDETTLSEIVTQTGTTAQEIECMRRAILLWLEEGEAYLDERDGTCAADRVRREVGSLERLEPSAFRNLALQTFEAVWAAVEDLDSPCENLHPVDVIQKHLQRGNIIRDGQWAWGTLPPCEMVVDWDMNDDGTAGAERTCIRPAVAQNGRVPLCATCLAKMVFHDPELATDMRPLDPEHQVRSS